MSGGNVLSLLGLALRGGRLAVGEEPAALAAKSGQARLLLAASDAAGNTLRRTEHLAQEGHCLWLVLPFSKEELGGALGRASAAVAALTDTGLAAAVTERLAQLDPERYAEAAARMDLKRRRAKERKSAPRRDPPKKDADPKDRRPPASRRERDERPPRDGRGPGRRYDGPRKPSAGQPERSGKPGKPRDGAPSKAHSRLQGGKASYSGRPGQGGPKRRRDEKPGQSGKRPGNRPPRQNRGGPDGGR